MVSSLRYHLHDVSRPWYQKVASWKRPKRVASRDEFEQKYGSYESMDATDFQFVSRVEPLHRALSECNKDILITGRRMDLAAQQLKLSVWQDHRQTLNPLADIFYVIGK